MVLDDVIIPLQELKGLYVQFPSKSCEKKSRLTHGNLLHHSLTCSSDSNGVCRSLGVNLLRSDAALPALSLHSILASFEGGVVPVFSSVCAICHSTGDIQTYLRFSLRR